MIRSSLSDYWERIRSELTAAFAEKHTPHEVAGSFAIGVFVTMLPSAGLGLVLFLLLVRVSDRISGIAIFASALVINPVVKAPMFIAAFWIGTRLLGPTGDVIPGGVVASAPGIAIRIVSGFVVLGAAVAILGYAAVYVLTREYRRRDIEIVEAIVDDESLAER